MAATKRDGKFYCCECKDELPAFGWKAGQCSCGRFAWWCDDGGNYGVEGPKKKDRVPGQFLERLVRPWA